MEALGFTTGFIKLSGILFGTIFVFISSSNINYDFTIAILKWQQILPLLGYILIYPIKGKIYLRFEIIVAKYYDFILEKVKLVFVSKLYG